MLQVVGNDDLGSCLHRGGNYVLVLLVVLHRRDQRLVARHHRLRECFSHDCAEPRGSLVGHSSGIDQAPARLFEDLVGPVELEQAFRGRPQQRVAERERVENVRVQNDLEGRRNHPS